MPNLDAGDLYSRLGVPRSATSEEIKRAYLALVREYTPERAPEAFKRIREAYETLSNPGSRNQYDTRPDPRIAALLSQASEAMKAQNYQVAEQAYKKVLLEAPGLHWVRNLLGLCFLYQQQAEQAVAQYERLLREWSADASIHGNAGHAYRMAKRFVEAEREFRNAMRIGGDQAIDYGLALIQMLVDKGEAGKADQLAVSAAKAATAGSPAASEYMAKRIELALILGRRESIPALLTLMTKGLATEEHRRNMAFALGKMAGRMIGGEIFQSAVQVAKVARELQPSDPDYDALELAGQLLHANDFDGMARLLSTHVSFASAGWLQGLKPVIQRYCEAHAAFKGMQPVSAPPSLFRLNGFGTTILGHRDDDARTNTYVVTQYVTALFIPLFPVACYRVRSAPKGGWFFLGRVPLGRFEKIYLRAFLVILAIWILYTLVSQNASSSGTTSSSYPSTQLPIDGAAAGEPQALAEPSTLALATYDGEAVNTTSPSRQPRARIRLTINDWNSVPMGYLSIFPPLGGSGDSWLQARPDSIRFATISNVGDTIVWLGARTGDTVSGYYQIVGGRYKRQYGTWHLSRTSGAAIPLRLNPW